MSRAKSRHPLRDPLVSDVFSELLKLSTTPFAIAIGEMFNEKAFTELVNFEPPKPDLYDSAQAFSVDYLLSEVLSKYDSLPLSIDRKKVALDKFQTAEDICRSANSSLADSVIRGTLTPYLRDVLFTARKKIADCLGPFSWDDAERHFCFGPGAAVSVPRRQSDAFYKFGVKPTVTTNALLPAKIAIKRIPAWHDFLRAKFGDDFLEVVPGNKVVTVPKNAKTERVIAIEPLMNIFIQKGIGSMIRFRLKRQGVDLDDQTLNQRLAREGSLSNSLCTVDLSMASDTICYKIVELLLPLDWFDAMCRVRSPRGTLPDGRLVTYHKFSSMGNGFTFELESLIFWAILKAIQSSIGEKGSIGVYGDDLIAPINTTRALIEALPKFGFSPNSKKTFLEGPFRESCGKHYFRGVDVTPFYIRKPCRSLLDKIGLANNIRLKSHVELRGNACDLRFKTAYDAVLRSVFRMRRTVPKVPLEFGDAGILSNLDEAHPSWNRDLQAWNVRHFVSLREERNLDGVPLLLKSLLTMDQGTSLNIRGPSPYRRTHHQFEGDVERRFGSGSGQLQLLRLGLSSLDSFLFSGGIRDLGGSLTRIGDPKTVLGTAPVTQWYDLGPWL